MGQASTVHIFLSILVFHIPVRRAPDKLCFIVMVALIREIVCSGTMKPVSGLLNPTAEQLPKI